MAWRIRRGERGAERGMTTSAPQQDAPDSRPVAVAARPDSTQRGQIPRWLQTAAGWSWRLLLLGLLLYVIARLASALRIVVLPCVAALLLTALLQPLTTRLKRAGMPAILATWCSLLAAVPVIAGVGTLIGVRVSQEYPTLVGDVTHFGHQVQSRVTSTVLTSTVLTSTVLTSTVLTSRRRRKDCG
jgi:predicted PurR-regulated permease PerM